MEEVRKLKFRKPWSRSARVLFWIFCIGFGVFFILCLVFAGLVGTRAFALAQSVREVQRSLKVYDLSSAQLALQDASSHATALERTLSFVPFVGVLPYIGETYVASLQALHVVVEGFDIAYDAVGIAYSITDAIDRAALGTSLTFLEDPRPYVDFSEGERRAALNAFAQSAIELRSLRVALVLAEQDLARIDANALRIPEVINALALAQEKIPSMVTAIDILAPFASVAREFAGVDAETQFLILYLNNAELRPGGGFIGAYSLMNIDKGQIVEFSTEDSYFADQFVEGSDAYYVAPPAPIQNYLGIPEWYFRDASWSPSFVQTAQDARQLLRQELSFGNQPVPDAHHVIGITPDFIEEVLRLVGPISANGATYTADNVYELLQYQVEQGFVDVGTAYEDRKLALKIVSKTMIERLLEMSPTSWIDFFAVFHDELNNKHVAFASTDTDTQAFLEDAGWAGIVAPSSVDDVFFFVDANLGALKTDPVVDRNITYRVSPSVSGGYRATATIVYTNNGVADYKTGQYRTYAQLFVPFGAVFVSSSGTTREVFTEQSLGMTSFGTFLEVELGESRTVSFTYDLPETVVHAIERGVYTLGAFKQMGARDNLLTLDLDFGTNLVAADPQEDPEHYGNTQYEYITTLSSDAIFRITL
ncbi:MAG: DUF4012 domain-containing protein [Patescibacteria group bacterium]